MLTSTIPFLIAKAHAYHSQSPTLEQIHAMVQAKSLSDIESILQQTHYAEVINEIRPSVSLTEFEVALRRNFAHTVDTFKSSASSGIYQMLEAFELTIEAENMSMILQAILRENVTDDIRNNVIPVGKFGMDYYNRMMGVTRVDAAIDFITHPTLRHSAEDALKSSNDPDEQIFFLASSLSHSAYNILNSVAPHWSKNIIETLNLMTVARSVKMKIDPRPWMINNNGNVFQMANALSSMNSAREVFNYALNHHFPRPHLIEIALQSDEDRMVSVFEQEAQMDRYYHHRRSFRIFGNKPESILDFFFIKKAEIEDLSRILLGNLKSISSDQIMDMLALPLYRRKQQ